MKFELLPIIDEIFHAITVYAEQVKAIGNPIKAKTTILVRWKL